MGRRHHQGSLLIISEGARLDMTEMTLEITAEMMAGQLGCLAIPSAPNRRSEKITLFAGGMVWRCELLHTQNITNGITAILKQLSRPHPLQNHTQTHMCISNTIYRGCRQCAEGSCSWNARCYVTIVGCEKKYTNELNIHT